MEPTSDAPRLGRPPTKHRNVHITLRVTESAAAWIDAQVTAKRNRTDVVNEIIERQMVTLSDLGMDPVLRLIEGPNGYIALTSALATLRALGLGAVADELKKWALDEVGY